MLTLLLGTDWTANRDLVLNMLARDVSAQKTGRILIVPELISHDTERRLCQVAGDTSSRFAEVLTFTRLVQRVADAAGFGVPECLDNGGRLVAMASATRQLHSKLKAYAAVETRPEFLTGLLDSVDELKRCCITAADLQSASTKTEGSFAQKLEELSLILEAYDSVCARGKRDPRDQMSWLLEQLEECSFADEHTFYIDGFPDFTRQHTDILEHLITHSENVVISLNCDAIGTVDPAFEKAGATAAELLKLAQAAGVSSKVITVEPKKRPVMQIMPALFQGKIEKCNEMLQTYHTESVHDECHAAAERILNLVQNGCRYRDISVVCTDMTVYRNTLGMVFARYGIPVYLSGTEDILDKTVITTVLSAIDAAVSGLEQADVLRYLKSTLSPLDMAECDQMENYAIIWNITGSRWENQWENHPEGLGVEWTENDKETLKTLNNARISALTPLVHLGKAIHQGKNLREMVCAVCKFLEDVALDTRLKEFAARMEENGNFQDCQILGQLWEILLSALEQLSDMLGDTCWDAQTFTRLLKLLLSQYDVGTIPAVLDAVSVGPVSAMRCQQPKHLFVLGTQEGSFPAYSGSNGIFTDQERDALRRLGVPLTGGAMEGLQAEFAEIYGVFCGAESTVTVSFSGSQPSFLYKRLCTMAGGEALVKPMGIPFCSASETSAYLVRVGAEQEAEQLGIYKDYCELTARNEHDLGAVSPAAIQTLYGSSLKLSASQVDKLADCRLAYFLKYGLKLKERKQATVDPAEFGTYVHAVLEETGRKVMELGGFHVVTLEQTLKIANGYSQVYIAERFQQIDSQRLSYLFNRNAQELEMVVTELWNELQDSAFEPMDFELAFGIDSAMEPISINGQSMTAMLRGFVDRIDKWEDDGQIYYRVVDYKTGKKDFDYCDIFNGLGLQMLLYLFALEENGTGYLGNDPIAAGVQYFPARAPIVPVDGRPEEADAEQARQKLWKRKGLLLADEKVLKAMESSDDPVRLPYTKRKDGTVSGDLADRKQFQLLKGYVFALLGKMVDEISSGCVEPNPYSRGTRHNACAFCPYGSICRDASEAGRRDYAAMSPQKFWEEVEKEMNKRHG